MIIEITLSQYHNNILIIGIPMFDSFSFYVYAFCTKNKHRLFEFVIFFFFAAQALIDLYIKCSGRTSCAHHGARWTEVRLFWQSHTKIIIVQLNSCHSTVLPSVFQLSRPRGGAMMEFLTIP